MIIGDRVVNILCIKSASIVHKTCLSVVLEGGATLEVKCGDSENGEAGEAAEIMLGKLNSALDAPFQACLDISKTLKSLNSLDKLSKAINIK